MYAMNSPLLPDGMTAKQAADLIGITDTCLRLWRKKETGPRYYKVGFRIIYCRSDIDEWMAQNRVGA